MPFPVAGATGFVRNVSKFRLRELSISERKEWRVHFIEQGNVRGV
jgi:hypothetical protein